MVKARRVLIWILLAFAIYAVFKSPNQSAEVVGNGWDQVKLGIGQIFDFFNSLMNT
ncbi:hypothetical protein ACIB24_03985 [Spongisporangium articulatum]|uniref:Uncharacterized protein n=1 Tax=Spongisporangium articulatum TaxID=3362603 RepID=A0ABW8AIM4_9ACTN